MSSKLEEVRNKAAADKAQEEKRKTDLESVEREIRESEEAKQRAGTYEEFREAEQRRSEAATRADWLKNHAAVNSLTSDDINAAWTEERTAFEKNLLKDLKELEKLRRLYCQKYEEALTRQKEILSIRRELNDYTGPAQNNTLAWNQEDAAKMPLPVSLPSSHATLIFTYPVPCTRNTRDNPEALFYSLWKDPQKAGDVLNKVTSILRQSVS